MKFRTTAVLAIISTISLGTPAYAQSGADYHPFLTDTFMIGVGAFFPTHGLNLSANGSHPEDEIDFDAKLGVSDSQVTPAVDFRWSFTEKWSLWGQWWKIDSKGSSTLTEDIVWDDITFKEGTMVGAGVDFSVARIFIGRELWTGPQYELGLGLGLHWMDTSAFIEGQIITSEGQTEFQRGDASFSAPLPNIGAWYYYSPSAKWLLSASVDWLSASIGKYDGTLWNISAGVNYQMTEHFGLDLSYQFFSLDAGINDTDWNGSVNLHQNGPLLALTANW